MEHEIFKVLSEKIEKGNSVALITVLRRTGVSPSKPGMMMLVLDEETYGTVGGGSLEFQVMNRGRQCLDIGKDSLDYFEANKDKDGCGSSIEVYIKVIKPKNKLLIVGCGHVGMNMYAIARTQKFHIVLFDDRENFCTKEKFPEAEVVLGDVPSNLKDYEIDENTFIIVSRHSHDADQCALEAIIGRGAGYIGMLGSRSKANKITENLIDKGIRKEELEKVYTPIGINVGSSAPEELAIGVMAQILMVKNGLL